MVQHNIQIKIKIKMIMDLIDQVLYQLVLLDNLNNIVIVKLYIMIMIIIIIKK